MTQKLLIKCMLGLVVGFSSVVSYAASLEGFWRTIDDKTGQQVSIVEIKKKADNTYGVKGLCCTNLALDAYLVISFQNE